MSTTRPTTAATAATFGDADHQVGNGRRWQLLPLLDAARLTPTGLAAELGIAGHTVTHAALCGLSDVQADRWSIRLGFHPVLVWGWAWIEAASAAANPRTLIADDLRRRIDDGDLRPGDPLPPVKELAHQWRVASRTVTEATDELRREGLVSDPGRGRRPVVVDTANAEPRSCGECGDPIGMGTEHFPHRTACVRAVVGWCDCDRATHAGCCPTCLRGRS